MLNMKKHTKKQRSYVQLILSELILAQWWHPVASVKALNLLYQAMRALAYRRIAMAIGMASKVGAFFIVVVLYVTPVAGGRRGNTQRILAQWRLPVAYTKALNLLHWSMHSTLPRRIRRAIKTASKGGAFVFIIYFGINHKRS
jgi:hypothetical protein